MSEPLAFAVTMPLRFQIGARTLLSLPRRFLRLAWSLDDVLAGRTRRLPPLGRADGYWLASLPEARLDSIDTDGFAAHVRQHYPRHYVDLTMGHAAWQAGLSANTRQSMRRKARALASGGELDVRAYRTPAEIEAFHALARPLSARTYQERLLDAGLPDFPEFLAMAAAEDAVRAWLLFHEGRPIAYLCCGAESDTLRYDHVGHDPAYARLSPGAVLQAEALRRLFDDRFARFDFTEGAGQHKRQFATGAIPCVDLLLLRRTPANRAALLALAGFDRTMALGKRLARRGVAKRLADRVRRA